MENPSSRVEHYLSAMLGNEACPGYPEHTRTRIENYLEAICHRSISVNVMPTASEAVEGRIFQYVGETTTQYTQGYFYLCVNNGSEAENERVAYAVCTYGLLTNLAVDREQLTTIAEYSNATNGIIELAVMGGEWCVKHDGTYSSIEGGSDLTEIGLFGVTYDGTAGEGTTVVLGFGSGENENEVVVSTSGDSLTATLNEYTLAAYTQNSTGSVIFELKNDPVYGNGWQMLVPENLAPAQNPIIDLSAFGITLDGEAYVGDRIALFYGVEVANDTNDYQWLQIDVQPDLTVGRYLANWNATTGLPVTNPGSLPYTYSTGDYYIISAVGSTNYKPTGTTYSGTASTEEETEGVTVGDYYFFDGTVWKLVGGSNAINNIIAAISNATTAQKTEIAEALPAVHQHVLTQAQLDTLIQAGTLIDGDWYGVTD